MKNLSGAIGLISVVGFLYIIITKLTANPQVFLNPHGIALIVIGLGICTLASFPFGVIVDSFRSVIRSLSRGSHVDPKIATEIVRLTNAYQKGLSVLESEAEKTKFKFLNQCINLVLEGLPQATVLSIIDKRIEEKRVATQSQMNVMLTLSKYAPSLGLAATVLGMVDMLSDLSSADMGKLGVGMAIALSATFYGIFFANLVFTPLSEMIASTGEIDSREAEMVREGIANMLMKNHPLVVGEIVNSYIDENNRIDFVKRSEDRRAS